MSGFHLSPPRRITRSLLAGGASALALLGFVAPGASAASACQPVTSPTSGLPGTLITLTGCDFTDATAVLIGDGPIDDNGAILVGPDITPGPTSLSFIAPDHPAGRVDIFVQKSDGVTDATGPLDDFIYLAVPNLPTITGLSPRFGSERVGGVTKISGSKLTGAQSVTFGGVNARAFVVLNSHAILAVAPPLPKGVYPVTVTTTSGASPITSKTLYTYR